MSSHSLPQWSPPGTGGIMGRRPVVPIMQEPLQWSPLVKRRERPIGQWGILAIWLPQWSRR
jgi:hypothetical protein